MKVVQGTPNSSGYFVWLVEAPNGNCWGSFDRRDDAEREALRLAATAS